MNRLDFAVSSGRAAVTRREAVWWRVVLLLVVIAAGSAWAAAHSATGITESILDATLSSPVPGVLALRKVKEGDKVRQGDVLVELDRRLEELEVMRRKAVHAQSKAEYEVTKALFEKPDSSTPKVDVERRLLEYEVAKVEHELAEEQLRRRVVRAPFEGTIAEVFLQPGEACQAQQAVIRLVDTRQCYFVCNVEARFGRALRVEQEVELEIGEGGEPHKTRGKVVFVSPIADPASGLMKVKVLFANPSGTVRPGVAGKMRFQE
ncbi:MAG: efflux RND transporter periplasmic adaptor subunit [Verrucomicrobia bacterium]|nr:efflux RND transporter periplasmic adaptor subunit [Verrucomicrobiota bacterium]